MVSKSRCFLFFAAVAVVTAEMHVDLKPELEGIAHERKSRNEIRSPKRYRRNCPNEASNESKTMKWMEHLIESNAILVKQNDMLMSNCIQPTTRTDNRFNLDTMDARRNWGLTYTAPQSSSDFFTSRPLNFDQDKTNVEIDPFASPFTTTASPISGSSSTVPQACIVGYIVCCDHPQPTQCLRNFQCTLSYILNRCDRNKIKQLTNLLSNAFHMVE